MEPVLGPKFVCGHDPNPQPLAPKPKNPKPGTPKPRLNNRKPKCQVIIKTVHGDSMYLNSASLACRSSRSVALGPRCSYIHIYRDHVSHQTNQTKINTKSENIRNKQKTLFNYFRYYALNQ